MLPTILDLFVKIAAGVAASLLVAYTPALVRYIRERVKNATAREALAFLTTIVSAEVASRAARVRDLKDPLKPGAWSTRAAEEELNGVIEAAKAAAPEQVEVLRRGLATGQSLDAVLRTMTEAEVERLRRVPMAPTGVTLNLNGASLVPPPPVAEGSTR